ncbi:MAG TPA: penicillinase repressor [Planctomycetaceae bacterium]|nr:penicillinase repressor [Planctomycetaceae bacterium]
MSRTSDSLPELSPAQREIMEIIWDVGEASVSDVRSQLPAERKTARNTVRTLLERMEQKGWLKHREVNRTFVYSATRRRNASIGQKVVEIVEGFCEGSPETLVTALLDYRGLSSGELARIRTLLEEAKASKSKKRRS